MKTYSQVYQDQFVLKLIGKFGFFLDLGAGWDHSGINSNSLLLEELGWSGICIDGNYSSLINRKNFSIRSHTINAMIPQTQLRDIFKQYQAPKTFDYVSLDIDPTSIIGLENFPFDEYDFKVMTFEHDFYAGGDSTKLKSYEILSNLGYVRLCNDVKAPNGSLNLWNDTNYFEDWWINPKYFNSEFIKLNTFDKQSGEYIVSNIKTF
jgi:hypothetical protein